MTQSPSTRRDPRFRLLHDNAEITFVTDDGSTLIAARLTAISVAGLSFRIPNEFTSEFGPGSTFGNATVRIGHCSIEGRLTLRNLRPSTEGDEFGCLFYPADETGEDRWMALLEGFAAAGSLRAEQE